jgi:hypothetical protein
LHHEEEDDEAHPSMPSERRGMVCSGGAMVRWVVAVGFPPFVCSQRKGKKWRVVAGGGVDGKRG